MLHFIVLEFVFVYLYLYNGDINSICFQVDSVQITAVTQKMLG